MTSRSRGRRPFIADQTAAAALDVESNLVRAAARTGRQFTRLDERDPATADPLASFFIRAYLSATSNIHTTCEHLSDDAPQPRRWDSALPGLVVCRARCAGLGLDLHMRTQGYLPALCGRCALAPAPFAIGIAFAETLVIGRACGACMAAHSPSVSRGRT